MDRPTTAYDEAFAFLAGDDDFRRELAYHVDDDQAALFALVGAVQAKFLMMSLSGLWAEKPAAELAGLVRRWTRRHLESLAPGQPFGYGPLCFDTRPAGDELLVTVTLTAVTDDGARGGCLRLTTLPPLPLLVAVTDRDDWATDLSARLRIPLPLPTSTDEPLVVEALFWGYDATYTDGRLNRGVVQGGRFGVS